MSNDNDQYISAFTCIIQNLPVKYNENGRPVSQTYEWLKDLLLSLGYREKKVTPMGCGGEYGLIEFGTQGIELRSAGRLAWKFNRARHGKFRWLLGADKKGPYVWLAKTIDLPLFGGNQVDVVTVDSAWKRLMMEEYYLNDMADTYAITEEAIATRC
ncbi:hypothetical protein SOVF_152940 [Spinacia oleracea]|nr:hypothetical protein SOVF_152940 [Spinacia oleracea]